MAGAHNLHARLPQPDEVLIILPRWLVGVCQVQQPNHRDTAVQRCLLGPQFPDFASMGLRVYVNQSNLFNFKIKIYNMNKPINR
jgi:hypothetical protein